MIGWGIVLEDETNQKGKLLQSSASTEPDREVSNSIKSRRKFFHHFRGKKYIPLTIGLFLIILFSIGTLALIYTHDDQRIAEGVIISGLDVGNLTEDEAEKIVDKEVNRMLSESLILNVGKQSFEVKLEDLGLGMNEELALQEAYAIGREGSIFEKISSKISARKGKNISFSHKWDDLELEETLQGSLEEFSNPATDAKFKISNANTMIITGEHVGQLIDYKALILKIKGIDIYNLEPELKVEFKEDLPLVTTMQLEEQKITGLLASYTTRFNPNQTGRTENVRLAAKALDMAVIKPGLTLSFNQIVGERTIEGGYKDAYIIVNGQFVPGLAGGICQVSTTLYNTGLLANLAVTQRSNHDLAITYAPLGQDATVAFPDLDLKFNNNTGGYLLVRTITKYNTLTIELYGKVKAGQDVVINNTIESIIPAPVQRLVDETLAHGASVSKQQGQPGYFVKSTRTVKVKGVVVSSEPLGSSHYKPLPRILAVGP